MAGDSSTTRWTRDDDTVGRGGTSAPTRSGATHAQVDDSTGATDGTSGLDSRHGVDGMADDEGVTRVGDVPGTIGAAGATGTEAAGAPNRCTASTAPVTWLVGAPDEA
ncbi:MAG TPA: hypothetical protein VMT69_05825 [Kineosporiaceae bacterium]|nr:hypothetical protein [Kineosporiaceae bacterium]